MQNAKSDLAFVVRYVPVDRCASYVALGWVDRGFAAARSNGWNRLLEWPLEKGEPVEPEQEVKQ